MAYSNNYFGWAPYVPVAERRRRAERKVAALQKKGKAVHPVHVEGRTIARTFWGKAWCENLEAYSDFANRLPRGRTYVRNGSVIDLQVGKGRITALVSGSSIYTVAIKIEALEGKRWKDVIAACSGKVDSLVELLQGTLSEGVMKVITCPKRGLFPSPRQISMSCSCPDSAVMCKHVAAVLYGIGARLDESPELFFHLRGVDHSELITAAGAADIASRPARSGRILESKDLSGIFGIQVDDEPEPAPRRRRPPPSKRGSTATKRKAASRKTPRRRTTSR